LLSIDLRADDAAALGLKLRELGVEVLDSTSCSRAELYDSFLVPLIFQAYASDLARRVAQAGPADVLETAAGTGVVTRALAPLLRADARYTVTDLNQPMLDRAAARQPSDHRIVWQQADALNLPFSDGSFDAVCCQFGVMFFPDRIAGYWETLRVLKPDGVFAFNVWDRIEDNEFARVVTDATGAIFPGDPPLFLARTPHGYYDVAKIKADLGAAGFSNVEIVTLEQRSVAASARDPAIAYCQGTPLRNEIEKRAADGLQAVTERAAEAIAATYGPGPVSAKIQAHVVIARPARAGTPEALDPSSDAQGSGADLAHDRPHPSIVGRPKLSALRAPDSLLRIRYFHPETPTRRTDAGRTNTASGGHKVDARQGSIRQR
jgi:SAM-dependent methyltransferase